MATHINTNTVMENGLEHKLLKTYINSSPKGKHLNFVNPYFCMPISFCPKVHGYHFLYTLWFSAWCLLDDWYWLF